MNSSEKRVHYKASNTYATLNAITPETRNIWMVFHGIGYLSRYFLRYFEDLDPKANYFIAPQAPAKYYLGNAYKHVGASWLTRENTAEEIENVMNYLDEVYQAEDLPDDVERLLFGFSQGVSIALRWLALRRPKCDRLILYAGGVPKELSEEDFRFLENADIRVTVIAGTEDEFITPQRYQQELVRLQSLFPQKVDAITFEGGHEIQKSIIQQLIS
ncbi:alpha/beta hydrolase [Poritiphilus flavus]|uniref:Esterase n=1 Tax=Poritiphilus flavus TaxID=2697053 RepID=A0A6L9EFI0_9FLAO|nr:esterase [Poritiphilus flavus]NAS13441.1 esterase [Poritiphilus flavus]